MFSWKACLIAVGITTLPAWSSAAGHALPSELFFASRNITPTNAVTYLSPDILQGQTFRRLSWSPMVARDPDTTVVLLNWSRLQNVILQADVYCGPLLRGTVRQVFVWNNQPNYKLEYDKHFATTGCSPDRLRIFNSPSNILFQARFMGCVDSSTRYCFLQDDDYITRPEILLNIRASFENSERTLGRPSPIILLPAHDHLEAELLQVSVLRPQSNESGLRTSFACLGHGTFLSRSQAKDYLGLLHWMGLSGEEMEIADNYFTILSGQLPNIWLTHTVELSDDGGGAPFTVGVEGNERNWKHIDRAMIYLDEIIGTEKPALYPHFFPSERTVQYTAPCITSPCTVHSNIFMLPPNTNLRHAWSRGDKMRDIQSRRFADLGVKGVQWYNDHSLSNAVDGAVDTAFQSAGTAKSGDYFTFALLGLDFTINDGESLMDLAWLVDASTASILHACSFEASQDGISWRSLEMKPLTCFPTRLPFPGDFSVIPPSFLGPSVDHGLQQVPSSNKTTDPLAGLIECYSNFEVAKEKGSQLLLRAKLERDLHVGWSIYEVWLRAL